MTRYKTLSSSSGVNAVRGTDGPNICLTYSLDKDRFRCSSVCLSCSNMEKRAAIPPGLPRANPTVSYWQDPPDAISDLCSTQSLPEAADIVIIGSGISGACVGYNILEHLPAGKVVMLEARQACSGATGRNGQSLGSYDIVRSKTCSIHGRWSYQGRFLPLLHGQRAFSRRYRSRQDRTI